MNPYQRFRLGGLTARGLTKTAENPIGRTARIIIGKPWNVAKAGAKAAGDAIVKSSPGSGLAETVGGAVKLAPEMAVLYGGKKAYDSETGQKARYKYQLWKRKRALRKAGYDV